MREINKIYINGEFVTPHGTEILELLNPTTKEVITKVTLADEKDTQCAIAAAKTAFKTYSKSSIEERIGILQRLHDAVVERTEEMTNAVIEEYGAPAPIAVEMVQMAAERFLIEMEILKNFEFEKKVGFAKVAFVPMGVVGLISPWNSDYFFIAKIATILSTGCTVVIKPSELSSYQTQLMTECIHTAKLPKGIVNIVTGKGDVVGTELTINPDISQISFTGSTAVGKTILREAADSIKRVGLELGGKSANIILDDANFEEAIPRALNIAYINNGQACLAGTRLFVPEHRLEEVKTLIKSSIEKIKVGNPKENVNLGPLVTQKQFDRVQRYIQLGIDEGAELITGGLGTPEGLENGYFVKPTVFANVTMDMTIAKEEIFGPVLSILTYKTEEEAIEMANNTTYGLYGYISSSNLEHAEEIASKLETGTVCINEMTYEPFAPFGGFKQSGLGREGGIWGFEEYLEVKTILSGGGKFPL